MTSPSSESQLQAAGSSTGSGGGNLVKLLVLIAVVLGLFATAKFLPLNEYLGEFFESIRSLGIWGPVILAVAYILATVFMVPGTILTLGAGFTFGLVQGFFAVSVGSTLGALAAFLVGRTMARGFVEQKAKQNPRFAAIDHAVEQQGFKIVLLTRLSPVFPFNLLNYLFSITNVRTRDYFLASWIGMIPGTIMYVYLGTAAKNLADLLGGNVEGGIGKKVLLGVGLLATIVVTVFVTRIARQAIAQYVPEDSP